MFAVPYAGAPPGGAAIGDVRFTATGAPDSSYLAADGAVHPSPNAKLLPLLAEAVGPAAKYDHAAWGAQIAFRGVFKAGGLYYASAYESDPAYLGRLWWADAPGGPWTASTFSTAPTADVTSIVHKDGVWLCAAANSNQHYRSTDGKAWTLSAQAQTNPHVMVMDGLFVLGGFNPKTSADGLVWAQAANPESTFAARHLMKSGGYYWFFATNRSSIWRASSLTGAWTAMALATAGNASVGAWMLDDETAVVVNSTGLSATAVEFFRLTGTGALLRQATNASVWGVHYPVAAVRRATGLVYCTYSWRTGVLPSSAAGDANYVGQATAQPIPNGSGNACGGILDGDEFIVSNVEHPNARIQAPIQPTLPVIAPIRGRTAYIKVK